MGDGNATPLDAIQKDVSWVREKIDPNHTLPAVSLSISPDDLGGNGDWSSTLYDIYHGGQKIGEVRLNIFKKQKLVFTERVEIDEDYQGKKLGFGLATYIKIIEMALAEGRTFRTHDWQQSEGAKHIWDILAERGVATVIDPFVVDATGRYLGKSEVRPR